jgi:hypothetical protein
LNSPLFSPDVSHFCCNSNKIFNIDFSGPIRGVSRPFSPPSGNQRCHAALGDRPCTIFAFIRLIDGRLGSLQEFQRIRPFIGLFSLHRAHPNFAVPSLKATLPLQRFAVERTEGAPFQTVVGDRLCLASKVERQERHDIALQRFACNRREPAKKEPSSKFVAKTSLFAGQTKERGYLSVHLVIYPFVNRRAIFHARIK